MENQNQSVLHLNQSNTIRCYICGHVDNLEYCSNCGHPLRNPNEKVGILLFFIDMIRDFFTPLATGLTTFFLFLFQPQSTYEAIFNGTKENANSKTIDEIRLPFISNFWEKSLYKKQKMFEPSGYLIFVTIFFIYLINIIWSIFPLLDYAPSFLKETMKQVVFVESFATVLLVCIYFAILSKIAYNELTWSNAYALSIYLNGTNFLIIFLWVTPCLLTLNINPIVGSLWLIISLPIFLIVLAIHSIISPIRFFPKILNIPFSRLITLLFLGYASFPLILFASSALINSIVGIVVLLYVFIFIISRSLMRKAQAKQNP